jgi:hypothetical protein
MPHPRSKQIAKIPQFSKIVNPAPALQSPIVSENEAIRGLPAPEQQSFNPRVAMYTFAFVGVLVGGLTMGVKSQEIMERREVGRFISVVDASNGRNMKNCRLMGRLQSMMISEFF